ncbi:MAG: hypothetical protein KME21_17185 [Desmonostoc vinosum HA7617-LM4]|jgi:hypothetical protein|nr:hypothetical protein [Desmonostoc vinosum HA7617-LM4]
MISTLILAWIIFIVFWKILKTTISTAFTIAVILLLLRFGFGITPQDIWHQINQFAQTLSQFIGSK